MNYKIYKFNKTLLNYLPHKQQPFDVIGRIIPIYNGNMWYLKEDLFDKPYQKTYPDEKYDPQTYIDDDDQVAYIAILDKKCIGSIRVSKRWNNNAFIDDLLVDRNYRRKGIGSSLMDKAVAWSKEKGLNGVSLETQNNNLLACRFYLKYGFKLGGMDQLVYTTYKNQYSQCNKDIAFYFYLF